MLIIIGNVPFYNHIFIESLLINNWLNEIKKNNAKRGARTQDLMIKKSRTLPTELAGPLSKVKQKAPIWYQK